MMVTAMTMTMEIMTMMNAASDDDADGYTEDGCDFDDNDDDDDNAADDEVDDDDDDADDDGGGGDAHR